MHPRDKVNKASWTLLQSVKDTVSQNLVQAARQGHFKIENAEMQKLMTLVSASVEEGYHKAMKSFMKEVDGALVQESMPSLETSKKK